MISKMQQTQKYIPETILSFLLLCRCFIEIQNQVEVDEANQLLSLIPADIKYTTEYEMLNQSIK